NLGNHEKTIEYGLKVFANNAAGGDAYQLAKSYDALKNEEKYVEWAQKTMELLPENVPTNLPIHLQFLTRFEQMYVDKKDFTKAAATAQKILAILDKVPNSGNVNPAEWKDFTTKEALRAWTLLGEVAYEKERWKDAMAAF